MKTKALKPSTSIDSSCAYLPACPFCGRSHLTYERRQVSWRHNKDTIIRTVIVCGDCGAQGPAFGPLSTTGERTAAEYWKRRKKLRRDTQRKQLYRFAACAFCTCLIADGKAPTIKPRYKVCSFCTARRRSQQKCAENHN